MKKFILFMSVLFMSVLSMVFLSGCVSNDAHDVAIKEAQYGASIAESEAKEVFYEYKKNTLEVNLKCPNGCSKGTEANAIYNDPDANQFVSNVPGFKTSAEESAGVLKNLTDKAARPVESLISGATGVLLVRSAKGGTGNTETHNTNIGDGNTQSTDIAKTSTASQANGNSKMDGNSISRDDIQTNAEQNPITTKTTTLSDNSNRDNRIDNSQQNQTETPTVVDKEKVTIVEKDVVIVPPN